MPSKKILRDQYISRIHRVQDYIEANLGSELTLNDLSLLAHFSPYHFHRIFKAFTGETLFQYIHRIRMEKSAFSLLANPSKPIVEIALEHGFSSQASFARAFKKYFTTSASLYRANKDFLGFKSSNMDSSCQGDFCYQRDFFDCFSSKSRDREKIPMQVEVKHVPEKHVIYVRHTGPYRGDSDLFADLFGRLFRWASPRDLINYPETEMLTVYHDSPEITADEKLRISACLTVSEEIEVSGEVGQMVVPSGKYAIGHFELSVDQYQEAWNGLFGDWLPESGYQPDDHPCFELYLNHPDEHPEKKHLVDIYLAVKPL